MIEKHGPPLDLAQTTVNGENSTVYLDTTYVGKQPKPGTNPAGGGFRVPPTRPGGMGSGITHTEGLRRETRDKIKATQAWVKNDYSAKSQDLPRLTDVELATARGLHPAHVATLTQSYQHELNIRNILIQQKTAALYAYTVQANDFYGHSPLNATIADYLFRAQALDRSVTPYGPAYSKWANSYQSAYTAKLLTEQIQLLNNQQAHVQNLLAAALVQEQIAAAEQARVAALAEAMHLAAEQARIAALAESARVAAEQARVAALAEAEKIAAEQARIAAQAQAKQIAVEQARLAAQAEIERQNEAAREALKAQKRAEDRAQVDALVAMFDARDAAQASRPFPVSGSAAAAGPVITLATGRLATSAAMTLAVRAALQTGAAAASLAGSAVAVGFAALVFPSSLGNGDRRQMSVPLSDLEPDKLQAWSLVLSDYEPDSLHALSVPLSDLIPHNPDNLYSIAEAGGVVELPVAIGSKTVGNTSEFFVVATNGTTAPGTVPVQLATFDPELNAYRSYQADTPVNRHDLDANCFAESRLHHVAGGRTEYRDLRRYSPDRWRRQD